MTDLAIPDKLSDAIPLITAVLARDIAGHKRIANMGLESGYEFFTFSAVPATDATGSHILLTISGFGQHAESMTVRLDVSNPLSWKRLTDDSN